LVDSVESMMIHGLANLKFANPKLDVYIWIPGFSKKYNNIL